MIFAILSGAGRDPSVIIGGDLPELSAQGLPGNAWAGRSDLLVVEAPPPPDDTTIWKLPVAEDERNAPGDGEAVEVKAPGAAMAVAQYAVLVVGLVMVLIGVVVMVANSKVT